MSEGQTFRNEDNAFLPLSSAQILLVCECCQSHKALCQAADKTLQQHTWGSSPLQVRPSLMFNCKIRVEQPPGKRLPLPFPSPQNYRALRRGFMSQLSQSILTITSIWKKSNGFPGSGSFNHFGFKIVSTWLRF